MAVMEGGSFVPAVTPSLGVGCLILYFTRPCTPVLCFSLHPLHVQLLSLVDINIEMVRKIHSFAHGILE
jgi:hypothetical protein